MIVIAKTIHGECGAHGVTCLGAACFVLVTCMGMV